MVACVSLDPSKHKMSQYAKVYTDKANSKQMTKLFAKEFFYEDLSKETESQKSALIIKDGCNDIIYEIEDFSKRYPNQQFTVEYYHKKGNKKLKEVKIKDGSVLETQEFNKKPVNKNSKNDSKNESKQMGQQNKRPQNKKRRTNYSKNQQNKKIVAEPSQKQPEEKKEKKETKIVKKRPKKV